MRVVLPMDQWYFWDRGIHGNRAKSAIWRREESAHPEQGIPLNQFPYISCPQVSFYYGRGIGGEPALEWGFRILSWYSY